MKKYIRKIATANEEVLGINKRNLQLVYPNNPREMFHLADDKSETKRLLESEQIPVPRTFALIEHSWEIDGKMELLDQLDEFVLKPANGSGGNGILILQKSAKKGWITPSGKKYYTDMLRLHMANIVYGAFAHDRADKCIVEERINPHRMFAEIYPEGIPDIRVILLKDRLLMAMLRMPTGHSGGKANLHQGAMGIGIDMENGSLSEGVYRNRLVNKHPDTGIAFKGMKIPYWNKIMEISKAAANLVPLKFIGVDIIVDDDSGPLIVEINVRPGLQIQIANRQGLQTKVTHE